MLPDYEIKKAPTLGGQIDAVIFFVWMLLVIQFCLFFLFQPAGEEAEGMRFRLIANSNTVEDQQIKEEVKSAIEPILMNYTQNQQQTYSELEQVVDKLSEKLNEEIHISTGIALFPPKVWKDGITSQTNVESIVISIGQGRGDNWWCSLFPKVCYKEEVEKEEKPKFWVWEWLKKKFST